MENVRKKTKRNTDHPDFGGGGHLAMLLKHPSVVREELLEAQAHGEDEQEPQHGAEEHRRQHRLALRTHGLAGNGKTEQKGPNRRKDEQDQKLWTVQLIRDITVKTKLN